MHSYKIYHYYLNTMVCLAKTFLLLTPVYAFTSFCVPTIGLCFFPRESYVFNFYYYFLFYFIHPSQACYGSVCDTIQTVSVPSRYLAFISVSSLLSLTPVNVSQHVYF